MALQALPLDVASAERALKARLQRAVSLNRRARAVRGDAPGPEPYEEGPFLDRALSGALPALQHQGSGGALTRQASIAAPVLARQESGGPLTRQASIADPFMRQASIPLERAPSFPLLRTASGVQRMLSADPANVVEWGGPPLEPLSRGASIDLDAEESGRRQPRSPRSRRR
jgi:hypothetical protein